MSPTSRRIRVAHLVSHPIQYFVPLYRALAQRPEIDLVVYFFSVASLQQHAEPGFGRAVMWDVPLVGGYRHMLCGDASTRPISTRPDWKPNWGILKDLFRQSYDVIWLHGYANGNAWLATALGRLLGTPVLLREEQNMLTPRSPRNLRAKRLILPLLFRNVSGLYIGVSNRAFFQRYGMKKTFPVLYGVDNDFFQHWHDELAPLRTDIRSRFGVFDSEPVVLFTGKFVDKKKPQLLLEAFRAVRRDLKCHLLLVGDGPLRAQLERQVQEHAINDVHFAGFLNQTEMPSAYVAADMFVLPSAYHETWGLVVNEAMNFSLPVIVSDRVGCAADLVREGMNGFVFQSGDVEGLADAIRKLILSQDLRASFARKSKEIIADYSISAICEQTVQACLAVTGGNRTSSNAPSAERKERGSERSAPVVLQTFESAGREVRCSDD
jgi:glycosyltransferase involved in cell wall biosynthesis